MSLSGALIFFGFLSEHPPIHIATSLSRPTIFSFTSLSFRQSVQARYPQEHSNILLVKGKTIQTGHS